MIYFPQIYYITINQNLSRGVDMKVLQAMMNAGIFRPKYVPRWCEKRIKSLYKTSVAEMEKYKQEMMIENIDGNVTQETFKRYVYYAGQADAIEGIMERLFI